MNRMEKLSPDNIQNKLHRVVEIYVPHPLDPQAGKLGSGFAVTDDLILTAKHIVQEAKKVRVRGLGEKWPTYRSADVVWLSAIWDAALLKLADSPWFSAPDRGTSGLRWVHLSGQAPISWIAYGFPLATQFPSGLGRELEAVAGDLIPGAGFKRGTLFLNVKSALPLSTAEHSSPWQGLSGAAILTEQDRKLIGLIIHDPPSFETSRLQGIPVEHLIRDPEFARLVGVQATEPVGIQSKQETQTTASMKTLSLSRTNRERMLKRVRAFWIKGVLEQSLHHFALIALGLHEQPDAVASPWRLVMQEAEQPARSLPAGTHITEVYNDADGELLILGEPGAGKTTLLLELARDLLDYADQDPTHPIPVVFNLSSWAVKRQSFETWLVEELNLKYQVPRKVGRAWIGANEILPLLDGLDEVTEQQRSACIEIINAYRHEHAAALVMCSRRAEYQAQVTRITLQRAVLILPLSAQQVDDYLSSAGGRLEAVREALHLSSELQEMTQTPLMLSILALAYQGETIRNLPENSSSGTLQQEIFATYVQRMLQRRSKETHYTSQQTIYWLVWLSQQMIAKNQTDFYIERMQIDWFSDHLFYQLLLCINTGLLIALFGWIAYGIFFWSKFGLAGIFTDAVFGCLIFLIIYIVVNSVILPLLEKQKRMIQEKKKAMKIRSWMNPLHSLTLMFGTRWGFALLIGIPCGCYVGFVMGQNFGIIDGLAYGLSNALILTLEFFVFDKFSIEIRPVEIVVWSWMSIRRNLRNSILSALGYALLMGVLFVIDPHFGLKEGTLIGLLHGFVYFIITNIMYWGASQDILKKTEFDRPNQGIRRSFRNCLFLGTGIMCLSGLLFWLILALFGKPLESIYYGVLGGVILGGIVALWGGGFASFQHYFVRILLQRAGYIPWDYVRFLDYAADRILLRKVGGGYIFIHRLLLDYFSSLKQKK